MLVVCLQLPGQLLLCDPFGDGHGHRGRGDVGDGVSHLAKMLDVLSQCFTPLLVYG